ncbi:peptide-methionine (S)-S-oxide reductase MsrA [Sulfurimicrobium lacus]|uniref:peptide-methionine (S)-S-oxide reductase MsrA n=1 Tax=Sulfurimicrobium lacus TaxID=2715678 RepID=UPI001564C5CD|nr:peptide-methionine (S)-S-oxide reductase MsrA [Sulfurimicrobium lacus]
MNTKLETATLGGGCFWCIEAALGELAGVEQVLPGYSGGSLENPDYDAVCSGTTGHAEVVRVSFDSGQISYREILTAFFAIHDPTTLNRQGNDVGSQYRSVIFYHSPEQKAEAEKMIAELTAEGVWARPIVTEIVAAPVFYPAEDYHRDYYKLHAQQPYCQVVVAPKVAKLRSKFAAKLKSHER